MSAPEAKVSCKYGAPMGRGRELPLLGKVSLRKVRLNGDYDQGGAYWGYSPGSELYYAEGSLGWYTYVRAPDRASAKSDLAIEMAPGARFYR